MKLKTLKDLEEEYPFEQEAVWVESLQRSAREWIKELERYKYPDGITQQAPKEVDQFYEYIKGCPMLSRKLTAWIKHFFNLEEDK